MVDLDIGQKIPINLANPAHFFKRKSSIPHPIYRFVIVLNCLFSDLVLVNQIKDLKSKQLGQLEGTKQIWIFRNKGNFSGNLPLAIYVRQISQWESSFFCLPTNSRADLPKQMRNKQNNLLISSVFELYVLYIKMG